jgi:hypothetical protein
VQDEILSANYLALYLNLHQLQYCDTMAESHCVTAGHCWPLLATARQQEGKYVSAAKYQQQQRSARSGVFYVVHAEATY